MSRARVFHARAEDLLPRMPDNSFDSICTDPPYGLSELPSKRVVQALTAWLAGDRMHVPDGRGFMGKEWDKFVPPPGIWDECFRVLKPGAYLLAFAAPRTAGLMDISIRLAGFEIVDTLHWVYGSGFPKSKDIAKAIEGQGDAVPVDRLLTAPATDDAARWAGWGTALKPAHEPIILARKPLAEGTYAANVLKWGTGGLNIDGCRVHHASGADQEEYAAKCASVVGLDSNRSGSAYGEWTGTREDSASAAGRWPPNLLLTHHSDCRVAGTRRVKSGNSLQGSSRVGKVYGDAVNQDGPSPHYADAGGTETVTAWDCAPGCPVAGLDAQSGDRPGFSSQRDLTASGGTKDVYGSGMKVIGAGTKRDGYNDNGGASRFYPQFTWSPEYDLPYFYCAKASKKERPQVAGLPGHPTVKPLALMRWLVRLVTPPGGTVGDFFAGTGTTVQACLDEGFRCVAADRDLDSVRRIRARLGSYAEVRYSRFVPDLKEAG